LIDNNIDVSWSLPNGLSPESVDDELIKLMKKAGFYQCMIGIQHANPQILKNVKRNSSIEVVKKAIKILKANKIKTGGFFILGLPGETKDTIKEMEEFIMNSELDIIHVQLLSIIPGSEMWDFLGKVNYKFSYAAVQWLPEGLTAEDLIKAEQRIIRKFYLSPKNFFKTVASVKIAQIKYLIQRLIAFRII